MMTYKGYFGVVEFDDEAGVIRGRVSNIRDVITFQGTSVDEVRRAFRDSVDDYLDFCEQRGEQPERPSSLAFARVDMEEEAEEPSRVARAFEEIGREQADLPEDQ